MRLTAWKLRWLECVGLFGSKQAKEDSMDNPEYCWLVLERGDHDEG